MNQAATDTVLSGMRPTGQLHLGHLHGVLNNWVKLQEQYRCLFFVADWHALTTHYDDTSNIAQHSREMILDWLAAGVDPEKATLFIQSHVPEHAELHLLLSMMTPLSWLERIPSYKDQQQKLSNKDLSTYGFLGYPLLQSADILVYRAAWVPVGEDQVSHVELTREVARRFNYLYGREADFETKAQANAKKMGKKAAKRYQQLRKTYQETGDTEALAAGHELLQAQSNINQEERERLTGYLEGTGKTLLVEPQPLLAPASKMPGLDGQKMSKSYGNTISLRDDPKDIEQKLRTMPTDPARVRLTDAGNPERCPVFQLHEVYSDEDTKQWIQKGCTEAGIGCLECKKPLIDSVLAELTPMQERFLHYAKDTAALDKIILDGQAQAREMAGETLKIVRESLGLA